MLESDVARVTHVGDGTVGPYAIPYYFLNDADLKVVKTEIATGTEVVLGLTVDYTLVGAGDPDGGTLTLTASLSQAYTLSIIRDPVATQLNDYTAYDDFPAESHERGLDKATMLIQRLRDLIDRSLRQPDGDSDAVDAMPGKASRASMFLAFDADGNPIAAVAASGYPASLFMAALLQSADSVAFLADSGADAKYIAKTIGTAKGSLIGFSAAGTPVEIPVGANNTVLTADSNEAAGFKFTVSDVNVFPKGVYSAIVEANYATYTLFP